MGHIQVVFDGVVVGNQGARSGLLVLDTGEDGDPPPAAVLLSPRCMDPEPYFGSFGWKVILGEDFKKPA
jgi:hypothetical protein